MKCPYAFRFGRSFGLHAQCGRWRCSRKMYYCCRDRSKAMIEAEARAAKARLAEERQDQPVVEGSGERTREVANLNERGESDGPAERKK